MSPSADYLGMALSLADGDHVNRAYFEYCARHDFRLQCCRACELMRYPPAPSCPWCGGEDADWIAVEGRGEIHSYCQVDQAIQPGFKAHVPYLVLLVELDAQKGQPAPEEALRVVGNLVDAEGRLVSGEAIRRAGVGARVRMTFADIGEGWTLPQWTLEDEQPPAPWRHDAV